MSPLSRSTRSRSRSSVPRSNGSRSKSPMPMIASPKSDSTSELVASRPSEAEKIRIRSEVLTLITENREGGDDADVKAQVQAKLDMYKNTGGDLSDVIFRIGALTCGVNMKSYKICLIGNAGVGKTSLLERLNNFTFTKKYTATNAVNVQRVVFQTDQGYCVEFEVWDCAGCERKYGFGPLYYVNASAAIVMFDVGSSLSYNEVGYWHKMFADVCPHVPVVVVGNQIDDKCRKVKKEKVNYPRKKKLLYYETSNKTGQNVEKPFLSLARTLVGDPSVQFVNRSAPQPPGLSSDEYSSVGDTCDKKEAAAAALPGQDEEGL